MPVLVDRALAGCTIVGPNDGAERPHSRRSDWIEIGLVNNMPDAAIEATEQQFVDLLGRAARDHWIHLRFFSLGEVARGERARRHLGRSYGDVSDLRKAGLDALIVTGAEPKAAHLAAEPYWHAFTQLVDWASSNTISSLWSCLAAHAAVLHLDGIERVPLAQKCIGVFDCGTLAAQPLTEGLPAQSVVPHARWNTLDEDALRRSGYELLTRSPEAGVDAFARQEENLFLFLQGHPEYDALSLLNEYRRDIGRFLRGERADYPAMPRHYFDATAEAAFTALAARAECERDERLLAEFPPVTELDARWQPFAAAIYRNWIGLISAQKRRRMRPAQYVAALRLEQVPAPAA
jgi:homoserine O-succinyltransferase